MKYKRHPIRRFFSWVLALALIVSALGYFAIYQAAGKMDVKELDSQTAAAIKAPPKGGARVTNILLLGADGKTTAGQRADTMLLLSLDKTHKKLKLASFLRDSWVKFPDGSSNKLNAAAALGGAPLAMRVVSENFDIRIDHYILLNFEGFKEIVDALGGVRVDVTKEEAAFINRTASSQKGQFPAGERVKLDGRQALIYVRIRKLDSDFMRTQRQRKVLSAIIAACKANPARLIGVLQKGLAALETDMTQAQTASLGLLAPFYLRYETDQFAVPAEHTWNYGKKRGGAVVTLDVEENARLLRRFVYE